MAESVVISGIRGYPAPMIISQASEDRVEAFSKAVSTQSNVGIITSHPSEVTDLVIALEQAKEIGEVEILTDSDTITELRDLFITTTHLVDYIEDGKIEIRVEDSPLPSHIITEDSVEAIAGFPGVNRTVVETTEESFVEDTAETFEERFEAADEVRFRKPGYSYLLKSLQEKFGETLVEDFEAALREAKQPERPSLEIDPVVVCLLVGGLHEIPYYELSRWGEDIRFHSPATFSRMKKELEKEDILDYENIPRQVGRPRHRLLLGEAVGEERIEDIIATAIQGLSKES